MLSKQDPAYPGDERFLASGTTPLFRVGVPHTVGIVQVGNQITVSADGRLLTKFTDTQRPYLTGAFGIYCEDAQAQFPPHPPPQLPSPPRAPAPHRNTHYPQSMTRCPRKAEVSDDASKPYQPNVPLRWPHPRRRIMVIYGTRPEAVKVAPLIRALDESALFTPLRRRHRPAPDHARPGQRRLRDQARIDLDIHQPGQTLTDITTRALAGVQTLLA